MTIEADFFKSDRVLSHFVYNALYPLLQLRSRRRPKLYAEMIQNGFDVTNSVVSASYFLNKSHLYLDDGVLEQIDHRDFIEIYDTYGVQIFRSFNLYLYSSFSEHELATQRMDQLYDRPEFFNKLLFKTAKDLLSQKKTLAYAFCPTHQVVEKKDQGLTVEITYKFMAPVYDKDSNEITGVLVCESIKPLEPNPGFQPTAL